MGARRFIVVRISPKGMERNISGSSVIATVGTAQRTTEKLIFAVSPHRLRNFCGAPSTPSDCPSE